MTARTVFILGCVFLSGCSRATTLNDFQGEWEFIQFDYEGQLLDNQTLSKMSAKVTDNQFRMYARDKLGDDYLISVNGSKRPAEIDLEYASGENKGKKELGIYMFQDKTLKLCIAGGGAPRPTEFNVVDEKGGNLIMVLGRKE